VTRLTVNDIFASYVSSYGDDHVHRQPGTPFRGTPGHHYFVGRRVSNQHLAQISFRSNNIHRKHVGLGSSCSAKSKEFSAVDNKATQYKPSKP
jgi:hypothetical protein